VKTFFPFSVARFAVVAARFKQWCELSIKPKTPDGSTCVAIRGSFPCGVAVGRSGHRCVNVQAADGVFLERVRYLLPLTVRSSLMNHHRDRAHTGTVDNPHSRLLKVCKRLHGRLRSIIGIRPHQRAVRYVFGFVVRTHISDAQRRQKARSTEDDKHMLPKHV